MAKLDRVDRKILDTLQREGRITNVELSERAGITAPPCLRRLRALEDQGIIRGYHADVDPAKLGFGLMAFVTVGLHNQSEASLKAFEAAIAEESLVRECHLVNGEADFLLKIVAHDLAEYQQFLTGRITPMDNVDSVRTSLTIRTSKDEPGVPI